MIAAMSMYSSPLVAVVSIISIRWTSKCKIILYSRKKCKIILRY
jgi:hypothetical protein